MRSSKRLSNNFYILFLFCCLLFSCKKYLDAKPDIKLQIPSTVQDLQALLDYTIIMNESDPSAPEICSDDYYVSFDDWQSAPVTQRQLYIWDAKTPPGGDWEKGYSEVVYTNLVLDNVSKVSGGTIADYNALKGAALFFRSYAFYNLAQEFSPALNDDTKSLPLGICLRLSSDISQKSVRSTVQQTFDQIINDLKTAVNLLPVKTLFKTRPGKAAAYALLARTFLYTRDYDHALLYADSSLQINDSLMNYNSIDLTQTYPVPLFNCEVLFHSIGQGQPILFPSTAKVDTDLYRSYDTNDLRRPVFFQDNGFYGSYSGDLYFFEGAAVDEMYLTRAECYARKNDLQAAMDDLNTLLVNRWETGTFTAVTASTREDALRLILNERRKELVFRGTRWGDLKRLNQDPTTAITLTRNLNGQAYTLPPNDPRYVILIPLDVISLAQIQQNPR